MPVLLLVRKILNTEDIYVYTVYHMVAVNIYILPLFTVIYFSYCIACKDTYLIE